ncbi:S-layer glycoprotein N-glycosyltransferase AglJ [Methanotrichaceae archaeon M04Ac]|uniref:S-layer glycoprotein N-glycosyltransferase AglJ n=1 Tax=Candidatus Methanocrinis alkalitolerans TaxID=3033395 RepID=A0ABT5XGA8_9EURY|nr:S-layer glycoprotein N-glycosyltransferase AglJ [Candidatus Methanocrinis alkalitolerans]MCR3883423.1 S-layer glycoprotein N-glycosyltransferase AglJ [Methanothrix sp.]MDF0593726.1 S-layer glycoprotein N-glycosyltransferase AglJ [Candidatus Methanocrinis alkalitolerans]
MTTRDVCILIPTLNEEDAIAGVIGQFREMGFSDILVIDGNSRDRTRELAEGAGARVVVQSGHGKGQALKEAFDLIETDYIVMIDGDGTYLPAEVCLLLDPVFAGKADHVMGNRFANLQEGALTRLNSAGNRLINFFFRLIYAVPLNDILTGYRAFSRLGVERLDLTMAGFEIETEMTVDSVKKGLVIAEVPITYQSRTTGTKTKLNPLMDGARITATIYRMAKTHNPLFYFGMMGSFFGTAGFILGLYIVREWLSTRTEHLPLTILTAILIIVGFQLFFLGILGDVVASMHREVLREIYRNRKER